jgi:hypothetical protein
VRNKANSIGGRISGAEVSDLVHSGNTLRRPYEPPFCAKQTQFAVLGMSDKFFAAMG